MATVINPFTAVDGNGHVRANAKLYFYETGTSTPQNTYSDSALSVTNANPVVADSNGLFTAIYLGDPPDFMAYKAILKTSDDVTVWTADPIAGAPIAAPISSALLRGYLAGLQRTANTTTTLTLGAGVAMDDTNTTMLSLEAGTINCATVGADGLDAGALANNTWYHVFVIGKTDGTRARLASASVSSPTMPSGYTLKRRISSFRTDGSAQIRNYSQFGDEFMWSATVSTTSVLSTISAAAFSLTAGVPTAGITLYSPDQATQVANSPVGNDSLAYQGTAQAAGEFAIRTDTSANINLVSTTNSVVGIGIYGWVDRRGRDE
jgi:hypothetical protein